MRPSLTRRGYAVVAAAILALVSGLVFGGRALNAVFMPAVALLGITYFTASRIDRPGVKRRVPDDGTAGDAISVKLDVDADRPVALSITDELDAGVSGDASFKTITTHETLRYDLRLEERGTHTLGPVRVTATDVFGVWSRSYQIPITDTIIAFPQTYPLYESARLLEGYLGLTDEREQFDSIREYQRGDALRDVNWKHSAKVPDTLVVTEYAGEGATQTVTLGVDPTGARVDSVAEAAASVALHLLDGGVAVGLVTPTLHLSPARGESQRRHILTAMARLERDSLPLERARKAEVLIRAPGDGSHVGIAVEGAMTRFGELVAGPREGEPV